MERRFDALEKYAEEKENRLNALKLAAQFLLKGEKLNKNNLEKLLEEAFKAGHYVGHIRGEQYQSDLLEEYKHQLHQYGLR